VKVVVDILFEKDLISVVLKMVGEHSEGGKSRGM